MNVKNKKGSRETEVWTRNSPILAQHFTSELHPHDVKLPRRRHIKQISWLIENVSLCESSWIIWTEFRNDIFHPESCEFWSYLIKGYHRILRLNWCCISWLPSRWVYRHDAPVSRLLTFYFFRRRSTYWIIDGHWRRFQWSLLASTSPMSHLSRII